MTMRARPGLAFTLLLVSCGNEPVAPSEVTTADLHGRWVREVRGSDRTWSFREHGAFHPSLVDSTNVFVIYDSNPLLQQPLIMGEYEVVDGFIEQRVVWERDSGDLDPPAMLRNEVLSFTRGAALSVRWARATTRPSLRARWAWTRTAGATTGSARRFVPLKQRLSRWRTRRTAS